MAIPVLNLPQIQLPSQGLLKAEQLNLVSTQEEALRQKMLLDQQEAERKQRVAQQQQAINELKKLAPEDERAMQLLEAADPEWVKSYRGNEYRQAEIAGQLLQAVKTTPLDQRPQVYKRALSEAARLGIDTSGFSDEYSPEVDADIDFTIQRTRAIKDQYGAGKEAPSAVREFQYYKSLPSAQQQEFLNVKRNVLQTGLALTPTGEVEALPGITGAKEQIKTAEARGVAAGKLDVERQKGLAKASSALKGLESQSKLVTKTIDKAIGTVNAYSTGYGSYLSFLPNTDARKLKNYLDTIRANVGFDKLQQMRENSPTGGALGQVSEMENKLLQAVNGALDPGQADQLVENLNIIKEIYPRVLEERKQAFEMDYGDYLPKTDVDKSKLETKRALEKPIRKFNRKTGRLE